MDLVDSFCRTQQTWTQSSSEKKFNLQWMFSPAFFFELITLVVLRTSSHAHPTGELNLQIQTNPHSNWVRRFAIGHHLCPIERILQVQKKFNLSTFEYFSIWTFRPTTDAKSARNCSKANERIGQANKSNKNFHHANSICIFAILPKESNILWTCFN